MDLDVPVEASAGSTLPGPAPAPPLPAELAGPAPGLADGPTPIPAPRVPSETLPPVPVRRAGTVDATPTQITDPRTDPALLPPPKIAPMPEAPDTGLVASARYFVSVVRARHDRRAGMRALAAEIQSDVAVLDGVLGSLGRAARAAKIEGRVLVDENRGIDAAEARREEATRVGAEVNRKLEEEQRKFEEVERELTDKLARAEQAARAAGVELDKLTDERKAARERKKDVDRRQKGYLKSAEDREKQASNSAIGEQRSALRRSAEDLRSDAARLEPERVELEKLVTTLEEQVTRATATHAAARADLDGTRKALEDARAGHRGRRGELEALQAQKSRAATDAGAEIDRRLITLGTLLNLNRVHGPELDTLYARVDALKAIIAGREKEIDRLKGEADQLDRGAAVRGAAVIAGALLVVITVICILVVVL